MAWKILPCRFGDFVTLWTYWTFPAYTINKIDHSKWQLSFKECVIHPNCFEAKNFALSSTCDNWIFSSEKDKKYFRRGDLEKQKADEYRRKQEVEHCFCLSTLADCLFTIYLLFTCCFDISQFCVIQCSIAIKKQQKFYPLPKWHNKIQHFEQRPFVWN